MADLTDDVSSLLHTLLHNSSSNNGHGHGPHPPGSADPVAFFDSDFGFPGGAYYTGAASASASASASLAFDLDDINNNTTKAAAAAAAADCDDSEGQEETLRGNNPAPGSGSGSGRGSSKRTRAAEVHNLSEKRRRQRINEKLKALQKLIPNSNKTDKASMLDEAIEYLKQLQLQVQMLTMRNGTSLHPFCPPAGVGQLMNSPPIGALIDEANNNSRGISSFHSNQEGHMQAMFNLDSKPEPSLIPRMSENHNPGPSLILEPSMVYRPFSASIPSKVLCKDPAMPQLQLDMSRCGQSSSSGVST